MNTSTTEKCIHCNGLGRMQYDKKSGWVPTDLFLDGTYPCGHCNAKQPTARQTFAEIGKDIGDLVATKNASYGDSFAKCGEFLRLLYPNGIRPEQYADALGLVRVFDKQMRIATDKDALGENPWRDIAGYGILGVANGDRGGKA
jgi:hypothetical protein